jgi:G6PDH family F420-dependent oxidoreductase
MFGEALQIITGLLSGGYVNFTGSHYRVDSAKLWDLPESPVPIAVAVSGSQSISAFASYADAMVAVEPQAELVTEWQAANPRADRVIGQLPICWDTDKDAAVERAHAQFRWFGGGWKVNAELPGTAAFAGATQFVRPEDVAESIPCGPDAAPIVAAVEEFLDAGFTDVALVQIGNDSQSDFLRFAESELLPALRQR